MTGSDAWRPLSRRSIPHPFYDGVPAQGMMANTVGSSTPEFRDSHRTELSPDTSGLALTSPTESGRRKNSGNLTAARRNSWQFSHELRNPLALIQTALDLLERRGLRQAGTEPELATIKRQVQNLKRLVDDLLDVSRISRGKIELPRGVVELAPLVTQVVEALRPLFDEHRQELQVSLPEESICLDADPTRLEQVLFNLLLNAEKFTPDGGQVWLEVELVQSHVVIRVRDTGIGIEADLLPRSSICSCRANEESVYPTKAAALG